MKYRQHSIAIALPVALLLTACASDPVPPPAVNPILSGEQMLRASQGIAQLGARWQEGKDMVDRGQALQRDGQLKIEQGRNLVEEGEKIMRESEEGYKDIKR
ncbi:MAG: hypothetical protein KGZ80_07740 [Methylomonas sp.]|nr:hypothetical protein [Methylomonas sp.]PPD20032.1 MAG: hypothetical protein CTY23_10150 [Methylomonas sp.]PPD25895.1 MAG: hypothetical protein CTY22_07015 [Methylomonas sp.]PPD37341.1 MAG: hypothetical protein CTY21_07015 [Methylomonas sp.]PPD40117.1 MAG: hypothetical protein CTY17_07240 [Methylomonas sp.]